MKRFVSFLICAALTTSLYYTVYADDFSLRNDIRFNDSVETVVEKETLGFEKEPEKDATYISTNPGAISGIDGSYATFSFDEGKLHEMNYYFGSEKDLDEAENDYKTIQDGLVRKYGDPLKIGEDKVFSITTSTLDLARTLIALNEIDLSDLGGYGGTIGIEEWVVPCDDYYVKIDHCACYTGNTNSKKDPTIYHTLGYKYFTDDDLSAIAEEKAAELAIIDNDL